MHAQREESRSFFRLAAICPILNWLPAYERAWLSRDLIAGVTLAAYAIPVSLAYASLAGVPPQAGLYCYLLGGLAYAIFGTSRQAAIGPTSAISILIGSALGTSAAGDMVRQGHLAMAVAVVTGIVGILAWLLHLGNVVNFISETVLSGFKVGAGLVIASTQLPKLFGFSSDGANFFSRMLEVYRHLGETNLPTLGVGLGALILLIFGDRLLPKRPIALFVVVLSILVMSFFPLAQQGVKTVGTIPRGLPSLGWPLVRFSEIDNLLTLALACFLLSYVESISGIRTFALKHRYSINADQELLALGMANLAVGVGQGYPVAAGLSQSAVNEKAGARTQLSLVFASSAICAVLLFLTALMRNLPQPVLAAVVLFAVGGLINPREIRKLYRVSRFEFRIALVAMMGVLLFGILKGVLLAAIFSVLVMLKRASHPRIAELGRLPDTTRFADFARYPEAEVVPNVLVLRIESGVFYFNAQDVKADVLSSLQHERDVGLVVLDLSTTPNIDIAGVRMLGELQEELTQMGVALKLAEVHGDVRDLLQAGGLEKRAEGIGQRLPIGQLVENWKSRLAAGEHSDVTRRSASPQKDSLR